MLADYDFVNATGKVERGALEAVAVNVRRCLLKPEDKLLAAQDLVDNRMLMKY